MLLFSTGCGNKSPSAPPKPVEALNLEFIYGSEKKAWLEAVTERFNKQSEMSTSGKQIQVTTVAMGSGDCIAEVLGGKRQAHLVSPASGVFVKLGNADSLAAGGKPLLNQPTNLVLSPVVIAMWRGMAEKLGWPQKAIGWADIHTLAADPLGWGSHGASQWGRFRFGHTHPDHSNSGLLAILAEVSAATGKVRGVTMEDVAKHQTGAYLRQIESAVVHYGESTGFFAEKMFSGGPQYLSAAVLYENMVVESSNRKNLADQVVAIYPKEGTYWSDHPVATVNRPWVTPEHEAAAQKYITFLTSLPQQEAALQYGFRPAEPSVPLGAPLDTAHGVDGSQPQTLLEIPDTTVITGIKKLWADNKKTSNVSLVFDTSGSMKEDNKISFARDGAQAFLDQLGPSDLISILSFSNQLS